METITPPKHVRQILFSLQAHGHKAYLVGGCVRDVILGVQPNDWDICTSALPQEVMDIFPGSVGTGLKHGTVTVIVGKHHEEVTTFRTEGSYRDHRHPEDVSFVLNLNEDLSRRDFTMNAMAISADGLISDPFGGIEDIRKKLIRCVGEPERRFEEDALRMFRALRFSARLGFEIEHGTMEALFKNAHLAADLSAERVRDELEKLLLTKLPQTLAVVMDAGLLSAYIKPAEIQAEELCSISLLPRKSLERWCAFTWLLKRHGAIDSVQSFLVSLRLDGRTLHCCEDAIEILEKPLPTGRLGWKKLLRDYGVDTVCCAARCRDAMLDSDCFKEVKDIMRSGECFSLRNLAVNGDDLHKLGLRGPALGETLNFLLEYVMEYPDNNRRELLMYLAAVPED